MKIITLLLKLLTLSFLLFILSCEEKPQKIEIFQENWERRKANIDSLNTLEFGKSYLSIYSQFYSFSQKSKYNLTVMVSLRNTSDKDSIYILNSNYYNTEGEKIRTYFDFPIALAPLETVEIVINSMDIEGGTGSNFIFEWKKKIDSPEPIFEAVMNSKQGTQGIAFTTHAIRIE